MEECASVLAEAQSVSNTLAQIEPLFQVPRRPPRSSSGLVCDVGSVVAGCTGSRGAVRVCGVGGAVGGVGVGDVVLSAACWC
eukprot:924557-Rhodomonas_salina.1